VLNLGTTPASVAFPANRCQGSVLVSTSGAREGDLVGTALRLDANEGLVIALAPDAALPSVADEPGIN